MSSSRSYIWFSFHLLAALGLGMASIYVLFYVYLPHLTQHGMYTSVPSLVGMKERNAQEILQQNKLLFEASVDSGYKEGLLAGTVLKQVPEAGREVKANHKVILTLNARQPPWVVMPQLVANSMKQALLQLTNTKLRPGEIRYVPDLASNAVLEQYLAEEVIPAGTPLRQGSYINLDVGDGYKRQPLVVPKVLGLRLQDAKIRLMGAGFEVKIFWQSHETKGQSTSSLSKDNSLVSKQEPPAGERMVIGNEVLIWLGNSQSIP